MANSNFLSNAPSGLDVCWII